MLKKIEGYGITNSRCQVMISLIIENGCFYREVFKVISLYSKNLILIVCEQKRCKLFAFERDEPSVGNLLRYYVIKKFASTIRLTKPDTLKIPTSLLVNDKLPTLAWLHTEYAKRIELEARVPHQLRVSIYYFRILK